MDADPDAVDIEVAKLDARMLAAFDAASNQLQFAMMRGPEWGTDEAAAQFRMAEMNLWREVMESFLPFEE